MKRILTSIFLVGTALLTAAACGDDGLESLSNTEACADLCEKYDDCIAEVDKTDCIDSCQDRADASESVEAEVEACEACIDDKSCAEAVAGCSAECALVPLQVADDDGE